MAVRTAEARWEGTLKEGTGNIKLGSGAFEGQYNFTSRFEEGTGTNPEELIGAAYAGCFSMALNAALERAGHLPKHVATSAKVHITKVDDQLTISKVALSVDADVPGIDEAKFTEFAEDAKTNCIISRALNIAEKTLEISFKSS